MSNSIINSQAEAPFFQQLEIATAPYRKQLESIPVVENSLRGEVSVNEYHAFLTQAYHHVKHTVPLLMACGSALPGRLEWLREAVADYIDEEIGHQVWILNDIENLGKDRMSVEYARPALSTEVMISYAYDWVARKNPVGFFGMVYVLEKTSSTIATAAAEQIQSSLGLPKNAMSYMISHGSLDVGHMRQYELLVNRLESPADKLAVLDMAISMYQLYGNLFSELPELVSAQCVSNKAA